MQDSANDIIANVADRRARGRSWDSIAIDYHWDTDDMRNVIGGHPRYLKQYELSEVFLLQETEAEMMMFLRKMMRSNKEETSLEATAELAKYLASKHRDNTRLQVERLRMHTAIAKTHKVDLDHPIFEQPPYPNTPTVRPRGYDREQPSAKEEQGEAEVPNNKMQITKEEEVTNSKLQITKEEEVPNSKMQITKEEEVPNSKLQITKEEEIPNSKMQITKEEEEEKDKEIPVTKQESQAAEEQTQHAVVEQAVANQPVADCAVEDRVVEDRAVEGRVVEEHSVVERDHSRPVAGDPDRMLFLLSLDERPLSTDSRDQRKPGTSP